jgi:hypothetical protein
MVRHGPVQLHQAAAPTSKPSTHLEHGLNPLLGQWPASKFGVVVAVQDGEIQQADKVGVVVVAITRSQFLFQRLPHQKL